MIVLKGLPSPANVIIPAKLGKYGPRGDFVFVSKIGKCNKSATFSKVPYNQLFILSAIGISRQRVIPLDALDPVVLI